MSEEIKLKPCPFCCGEAELVSDVFGGKQVWFVQIAFLTFFGR